jgi:hypothetical protein
MKRLATVLALLASGCHDDRPVDAPKNEPTNEPRDARPSTKTTRDPRIPAASGDYSSVLADVEQYRKKTISFDTLKERTLARRLPPHPLGCTYLMVPVPMPPPGTRWNPWMMPTDWEHNWGEIAITFWVGALSREDHAKLHAAAHPNEPPIE